MDEGDDDDDDGDDDGDGDDGGGSSGGGGGGAATIFLQSSVESSARAGAGAGAGAALLQQITSAASTAGCIGRVKADLADSLAAEFKEASESQFVMVLVKGIVISLLMIMIPPFVQELVDAIIPRFTPLFGPNFIATAEPLLVMALNPLVYGPTGQHLIELCTSTLNARVGAMLVRSLAFHVPRVLAAELPPRLTTYMLETWAPSMGKALLYNVLHALTHSLADSLSHHLSQAVTQGVTHSISHALIHYYYCIYCYESGDFCRFCYYYNGAPPRPTPPARPPRLTTRLAPPRADWLRLNSESGPGKRFGRVEEKVY